MSYIYFWWVENVSGFDNPDKSEIAVPVRNRSGQIIGALDVDAIRENHFDCTDAQYLEKIVAMLDPE